MTVQTVCSVVVTVERLIIVTNFAVERLVTQEIIVIIDKNESCCECEFDKTHSEEYVSVCNSLIKTTKL